MKAKTKSKERADIPDPRILDSLQVRLILPNEQGKWDRYMDKYHYLGFRCLVGESLKYVATINDSWVALIGWGTAALKCKARDAWIGWSEEQQWQRLRYLVNNQRFLILPTVRIKNLASKALALNLRRLAKDWKTIYGHTVLIAETFVDPRWFLGTCYRAANWECVGRTQGYGRHMGEYYFHGNAKTVWVRSLRSDARKILTSAFLPLEFQGGEASFVALQNTNLNGSGGLLERLDIITDPRKKRGVRHSQAFVLAIAVCAALCDAGSYEAIAQWAKKLSQDLLKRMGARYNFTEGCYKPPSEPTIRRTLQSINVDELDRVVYEWLEEQINADAIAVDGKTLRGSGNGQGKPLHLMAALVHKTGVVVGQEAVDTKSNEITAFEPLLAPLDLEGKVITADAMHAQALHARYLVEEKKADYVFTVKANQPTIYEAINDTDDGDFSPSGNSNR